MFKDSKPNSEAWRNKYKKDNEGFLIYPLEPKFFGSTTFLVFTQDYHHFTRFLNRLFLFLTILLAMKLNFRWWHIFIIYAVWIFGFHLIYTIIFL